MRRRAFLQCCAVAIALPQAVRAREPASIDEARAIARDAYLYAFPMVENYLSIYQFALDSGGSQYKGPPNEIHNVARVFTPEDTGVVTPNSDTPYSFLVMDLRTEPLVVTLPAIEPERYYSLQLVDLYSHNVDYIGTRIDGNDGGHFLIAGPDWKGEIPKGIRRAVRIPTEIGFPSFVPSSTTLLTWSG